jgi:hypothetical protein
MTFSSSTRSTPFNFNSNLSDIEMSFPHLLQELGRKRRDPQFPPLFLCSVGSGAVVDRILGYDEEPERPIEDESHLVTLGKCGVHLLPCAVSLISISLNLKGPTWVVIEESGFTANTSKAQELHIVTSLTTVVAHSVQYDLI